MLTPDLAEIEMQVKEILAKTLNIDKDKITPDKKLREDLGINSFAFVELSFALEDQAEIDIPDEDLANLKTVQDVGFYLYFRLCAKAANLYKPK